MAPRSAEGFLFFPSLPRGGPGGVRDAADLRRGRDGRQMSAGFGPVFAFGYVATGPNGIEPAGIFG